MLELADAGDLQRMIRVGAPWLSSCVRFCTLGVWWGWSFGSVDVFKNFFYGRRCQCVHAVLLKRFFCFVVGGGGGGGFVCVCVCVCECV